MFLNGFLFMLDFLKYDFCEIDIHQNYIVVRMNEGISLTPDKNDVLVSVSETYFKNKTFGYVTHRINSYAVDPRIYLETSKIENLAAFAVVSNNHLALSNTQIEKLFFKKPFKQFYILEEAIFWINKIIENY